MMATRKIQIDVLAGHGCSGMFTRKSLINFRMRFPPDVTNDGDKEGQKDKVKDIEKTPSDQIERSDPSDKVD